jgi:hypothetical protein
MKLILNKSWLLALACLALVNTSIAQPCPENPVEKKGVWKNYPDDGLAGFEVHPVTM